jgi:hypothetical protein
MMMRMLEVGGMPVLVDHVRAADDDNPRGYFELEAVKLTKVDPSWLDGTAGHAVKMVYRLIYDLPADRAYRLLFMRRKLEEVMASQRTMLERSGKASNRMSDEQMQNLFARELDAFDCWAAVQSHIRQLEVDYNAILTDPVPQIKRVCDFLGGTLDADAMAGVVETSLYRHRA